MSGTIVESTPPQPSVPASQESLTDPSGASLWSLVDDRLRGRWILAIVIAFVLAMILGPAGYLSTDPIYQSTGLIRIAPTIDPILRETPETRPIRFYTVFVRTQAALIESPRVFDRALTDEFLAQQNCTVAQLKRGLTVKTDRNTELIAVQFDAASPVFAQAAVNAIIDAYYDIFGAAGGDEIRNNLNTLSAAERDLRNKIRDKETQLRDHAKASEYGTIQLDSLITDRVAHIASVEFRIAQLDYVLKSALPPPAEGEEPSDATPTAQQLAYLDPELTRLQSRWMLVSSELREAKERWKPTYHKYHELQQELAWIEERIEERMALVRPQWEAARLQLSLLSQSSGAMNPFLLGSTAYTPLTRRQIEVELEGLRNGADRARQNVQQMFVDQRRREELKSEAEYLKQDMAEIKDRIMSLEFAEDSVRTGRVSIAARGDLSVDPARDRRPELAILGILGGFSLSFGFFFLLGTVDRRTYRAAQFGGARLPRCLGVLPDLGRGRPGPEQCAIAAHCVHQIRNHIEVLRKETTGFVLAVSSPYQGDGKTNIVMALGWSYATAGNRTLLVDCDFTGMSLTHQMGMSGRSGLKEALRDGHVNGHVMTHRIPELSILPAGYDPDIGPETLRSTDLKKLFSELRRHFDIIIVDTGPTLASLEGILVASAADNTILSIRRGRRRMLLEECIERLSAVGVSCLGVVLNYADRADCDRCVSKSALLLPRGEQEEKASANEADSPAESPIGNAEHSALICAMTDASTQTRSRRVSPH